MVSLVSDEMVRTVERFGKAIFAAAAPFQAVPWCRGFARGLKLALGMVKCKS